MTIKNIAKICNVSTGTVNRALNGKPGIKPATKERILRVVQELNFQPNYYARTLATGKTNTIGLVLPNVDNEFFAMLCSGIEKIGSDADYVINLVLSNDDPDKERRALISFLERGVDGAIVFPAGKNLETIERMVRAGTKIVLLLNDLPIPDVSVVKVDDFSIIANIVDYLVGRGHRNIAYIDGYTHYSEIYNDSINRERYRGFRETLVKHDIMYDRSRYLEFDSAWHDSTDYGPLAALMGAGQGPPTAIACFHDRIALWVMEGLAEMGLRVPDDVSVTGVDNIRELRYVRPLLTTSELPIRELAEQAISLLLRRLDCSGAQPERISLDTRFVEGESVRDIRS